MQSNEPTPAQIDLIRKLVRSVTLENAHTEYDKARLQFTSKEEFQAALQICRTRNPATPGVDRALEPFGDQVVQVRVLARYSLLAGFGVAQAEKMP